MAKARAILARRKAVQSIHTVMRTMEMVATARFKRTFRRYRSARSYLEGIGELTEEVLTKADPKSLRHPLLSGGRKSAPRVILVLTSDRGLCGGYNTTIVHAALARQRERMSESSAVLLHVVGKRGASQLRRAGQAVARYYDEIDSAAGEWRPIRQCADEFIQDFLGKTVSGVDVAYARLLGAGRYAPHLRTLLPLRLVPEEPPETTAEPDESEPDPWAPIAPYEPLEPPLPPEFEYEFVPSPEDLFRRLLPMTVRLRLFQCFLEASVTEQIARRTAMRSAGENAEEMIRDLTVRYNRMRQGQITTELAEILGGRGDNIGSGQ